MSTGKRLPTAAESFASIAADPSSLRSFLACIGSSDAPSRTRAAQLLDDCESVCDVGCGPAVLYETLVRRRSDPASGDDVDGDPVAPRPLRYVGVDPVQELLHLAQSRVPAAIDVTGTAAADVTSQAETGERHALVLDEPAGYLARCVRGFDGVVLRHVVEHLAEPWALLSAAAVATRGVLVVVVSQATREHGMPSSVMTDHHLGAMRWSHWRPRLLRHVADYGLELVRHESGSPLVVREELFAWCRP